ncbi:MAG: cation:proton antiporter [Magnetococcus sp. DMHC-6]
MHTHILTELLVIFSLSVAVVYLCHRLRIASIIGFLIVGALSGPFGLSLVSSIKEVELLAEIGVMLLLFTIGLELSLKRLLEMKRAVFIGGGVQVAATIGAIFTIAMSTGLLSLSESIFMGFLVSLSSTAIVLKVMQEKGEVGSVHGTTAMGILIFQDLIIVPMLLMIPLLTGKSDQPWMELGIFVAKFLGISLFLLFGARRLIPSMLYSIVRLRDQELFFLSVIVTGLGVAWLTAAAGLSLALGAFMAGLILSESEYGHQAFASVLPFRDMFTSLFFVSVGMLLDASFLIDHIGIVTAVTLIILLLKAVVAGGASLATGIGLAASVATGTSLAQIGEFSFVLARSGLSEGLLSSDLYQYFLSVSVTTMVLTPLLVVRARKWGRKVASWRLLRGRATGNKTGYASSEGIQNHLIIVGFGENGRAMALLAFRRGIPFRVLETNPETVRRESSSEFPILFGDASHKVMLRHAGIMSARALVITVPDAVAARNVVDTVRKLRLDLPIIVRASFVSEVEPLITLGANHVIAMQMEASVAICEKVLTVFQIQEDEKDRDLSDVRANQILSCRIL